MTLDDSNYSLNKEFELKLQSSSEIQAKFETELSLGNNQYVIERLEGLKGWILTFLEVKNISDEYWDTPDLMVFQLGGSFRIRYSGRLIQVDVKEPAAEHNINSGLFVRTEKTFKLDLEDRAFALNEKFLSIRRRAIPEIEHYDFRPVFRVNNSRKVFEASKDSARIELAIDSFNYTDLVSGDVSRNCGEIEFEALNEEGAQALKLLAESVKNSLGFTASNVSKYGRGVSELKLNSSPWIRRYGRLLKSDRGLMIMAIATVGGALLGIIGILLAIFSIMISL